MKEWILRLKNALELPLPGEKAHVLMSPMGRGNTEEYLSKLTQPPRTSAVMLLLYPVDNEFNIVLIKRPSYDGVHSGQISLPGGKMEESDKDFEDTAIRETWEETGVEKNTIEILGALSRVYIPPSNFLVYPYIGVCKSAPVFNPDKREVENLLFAPVTVLLDDLIVKEEVFKSGLGNGWKVKAPYFEIVGEKVWGATAIILSEFKEILKSLNV